MYHINSVKKLNHGQVPALIAIRPTPHACLFFDSRQSQTLDMKEFSDKYIKRIVSTISVNYLIY